MFQRTKKPNGYKNTGPTPRQVKMVYKLALLGSTDTQMADFLEVPISTFNNWKQTHPKFAESMKQGKIEADANVAQMMYKKATGFWVPDVHIISNRVDIYNEKGKIIESRTEPLIVPIKKFIPPDFNAQNKWLSLRQRDKWSDIQRIEINQTHNINLTQIAEQLSDKKRFTTDEIRMALNLSLMDVIKGSNQKAIDN